MQQLAFRQRLVRRLYVACIESERFDAIDVTSSAHQLLRSHRTVPSLGQRRNEHGMRRCCVNCTALLRPLLCASPQARVHDVAHAPARRILVRGGWVSAQVAFR